MTDEAPDTDTPEGVFGNLPAARPGTRSPRRRAGGDSAERPAAERPAAASEQRAAKPAPPPPPPRPRPAPPAESKTPSEPHSGQGIGSIEDLAWAGVAVAAQAATVGVRFASRAVEAARKSVDRPD